MFFYSVYLTHPSDTVPNYTIYLSILLVDGSFIQSWVLFCCFILWLAKRGSKMPCTLLCEIEHLLEFVSVNPLFLSRLSNTKIQTAIIWLYLQQKSKNLKTYVLRRLFLIWKSQLIVSDLLNRKLSIVHPTLTFNFALTANFLCLEGLLTLEGFLPVKKR